MERIFGFLRGDELKLRAVSSCRDDAWVRSLQLREALEAGHKKRVLFAFGSERSAAVTFARAVNINETIQLGYVVDSDRRTLIGRHGRIKFESLDERKDRR